MIENAQHSCAARRTAASSTLSLRWQFLHSKPCNWQKACLNRDVHGFVAMIMCTHTPTRTSCAMTGVGPNAKSHSTFSFVGQARRRVPDKRSPGQIHPAENTEANTITDAFNLRCWSGMSG